MSDGVPALTVENLSQQMRDLVDWESFGINLPGISYTDIQIIKADHSKTQVQKMELFDTWIKAYPQATWEDVTEALEKNDEYGLAKNINLYQQHEIIKMTCDMAHIKQPTADALCLTLRGLSHWEELAVHLPGISREIIDEVKYCPEKDQKGHLFSKWLELFPSASWDDVLKAIDETMKQVREKIQAEHLLKDTLKKVILPYVIYKPTVHALTESLKGLKNWEEFGLYLPKLELSHIRSIGSSKHDDPVDFEKQLYSVWLTVHPTAIWYEVVLALEKSDNATLASTLRKILPFEVLHFNETPLEIKIGKETVAELRLLYEAYHPLSHDFEEAMVSSCNGKLSSVTRWVKRMPPYKLEAKLASVTSFDEFFDVIAIHHNFLNCYLLLSLAKQFLQNGSPYIAKLTCHSSDVQKFMESQKIQSLQTSLVPFIQKDRSQAPITIKLHHCYENEDAWVVEKLLEKLFGLEHSKLCQIFRVTPGSVLVTLLTPRYAVQELSSISKRKILFMKFVGILSLQIKTNYIFIPAAEANKYTFEKGLIAALEAYEYEAVKFLLNETLQVNVNVRAKSDHIFEKMKDLQKGIGRTPQLDDAEEDYLDNIDVAEAKDDNANVHSLPLPDLIPGDENSNLVFPRESGATPLMIACYKSDTDVIQLLLEKGANPNLQTETGWTALMYAAVVGSGRAIKLLLKYKAEIDKKKESNGITALHYGCQMGNGRAVDVLLEHSADPNMKMKDGVTPLYGACESGHLEIVRKLLKKEAKADTQKDADGATPLYAASEKGHFEVVDELIKVGVVPNRPAFDGVTPLYMASQNGHFKVVERLLQEKINPNVKLNRDDGTPLIAASWHGHLEIVEILLKAKADPNAVIRDTGSTPLFSASERGYSKVVERLLKEPGIAVDAPFKDGRTPLFVACQFGHFEVAQKLLEAHANPNTRMTTRPRLTPLVVAIANDYSHIKEILLQYGARY